MNLENETIYLDFYEDERLRLQRSGLPSSTSESVCLVYLF